MTRYGVYVEVEMSITAATSQDARDAAECLVAGALNSDRRSADSFEGLETSPSSVYPVDGSAA